MQKIFVIGLQQTTKFSVKVVNLETIIDMQSWCRTLPPNGSSRIRAKQKLLRKHTKELAKVLGAELVIYIDNLAKPFLEPLYRSETNGIAERAVRRVKKGSSAVLLQSGLDEKGG